MGLFQSTAKSLIEKYGDIDTVSRCLVMISGYDKGMKKVSLLTGKENYVTVMIKIDKEVNVKNYFYNMIKKVNENY